MSFKQKLLSKDSDIPLVMSVLNITPDSFSDGGCFVEKSVIQRQLELMAELGVDIVDIGGESTRPNSTPVLLEEELDRVLPVIELAKKEFNLPISIDTSKVEVMQESIKLGVDLINDVNALSSDESKLLIAKEAVLVCLMHKKGNSKNMQNNPVYTDVVLEVKDFFVEQVAKCLHAGINKSQLLIDPGFGFGKTLQHNIKLFKSLNEFNELEVPLLIGVSRKAMIADILGGLPVAERMVGSVSAALLAGLNGAKVVRVHDFKETIQAFKIAKELL